MRLLLVEDNVNLSVALLLLFKKNKYEADAAYDGKSGEEMMKGGLYDVVILNRALPDCDGVAVVKNIREMGINTPIMFLTAKNSTAEKVEGLDAGADDYLTKPFATEELMARIRALGRRNNVSMAQTEEITIGKAKFLPRRGELYFGKNYSSSVTLTLKETGILELLSQNPEAPVTKEKILQKLWGREQSEGVNMSVNIVEVFMSYLRKKIKSELCGFSIVTKRNIGYKIHEQI
ncbi:MAG: response regulator transcription factor [Oscillospiraceae bacterium]|nr:response regulator transcription factor [Oscillospiraceae bacterium]